MTSPTPIIYTLPNLTTAGSGRALFEIARRLDRQRFAPWLCLSSRGGSLEREFEEAGIPVIEAQVTILASPRLTLLKRARQAAAQLQEMPPGAIWHSFHYLDDYTEPIVARFAHAKAWVYTKKNMSWNDRSWQLRTLGAARVLAQNSDMVSKFFRGSWNRRARLVPRGVDTDRFSPVARRGGESLTVGCIAHLVPVKGHPTLLDAVAGLEHVELKIAGQALDDSYLQALKRQCAQLGLEGRVEFLGKVQDVPALLATLDAFVLPTWARWRQEGCPVALLEAMASGLPVIATEIAGSRDVVKPGVSGLLVPPEDPRALAAALERLKDSALRHHLGAAARKRALESYSIEREVADHEALYGELLGR